MDEQISALKALLLKEKFDENLPFYTGVQDDSVKNLLNRAINISIEGFITALKSNESTSDQFLRSIRDGLNAIGDAKDLLDTEDMERVCEYYEEIMDIAGIESSEGILNNWLYGFDPNDKG